MGDFRRTGAPEAQKLGGRSNNVAINSVKTPQFCDSRGLQIRYRMRIQNILTGFAIRRRAFANSSSWICTFATPGSQKSNNKLMRFQDGFAKIRLKILRLTNASPFS